MQVLKTTPIFFVSSIDPQLAHWRDRLGYKVTVEVPHGDETGFAILSAQGSEIMLQTFASGQDDLPAAMPQLRAKGVAFYHEVSDAEAAGRAVAPGTKLLLGPRTTGYGMREVFVLDALGFVHGYASKA